ncbi:MAG TPA: hypothetical protein VLF17_04135, partial [Candidatus Nitrosotenuis sp.]|nr:hypothetical protein [Candidatus Nitrosotenuis sp.]
MSSNESEPKKGGGYFANRLKEKGGGQQESPEPTVQADTEIPKHGQIFEESSKSIASMAGDMNETAKLVSSMKEGLQRVSKAVNLIDIGNPLCDPFGSCSYNGVDFTAKSNSSDDPVLDKSDMQIDGSEKSIEHTNENADKEAEDEVSEYTTEISNLKFDSDSIKDELQEFKDNIKQKETELVEFRTKLNNARLYGKEFAGADFSDRELNDETGQSNSHQTQSTEFDIITSNQSMDINSIQDDQDQNKLVEIRQEIRGEEKKLFELRWKTKKAESEYEDKRAAKEEIEDVRDEVNELEEKRDHLRAEIKKLETQNKEPRQELREL